MDYVSWIATIVVGAVSLFTGILGRRKTKGAAADLYLLAMVMVFTACVLSPANILLDQSSPGSILMLKVFVTAVLLAEVFLCGVAVVFPIEHRVGLRPLSPFATMLIIWTAASVGLGITSSSHFVGDRALVISKGTALVLAVNASIMAFLSTALIMHALPRATNIGKQGAKIYLAALWLLYAAGMPLYRDFYEGDLLGPGTPSLNPPTGPLFIIGVGLASVLVGYALVTGKLVLAGPASERLVSSAKAKYKLLIRHAYLVEEPKPDFAFKMFTDILKGRCIECVNDDSFICESLECSTCGLPCPCRNCSQYKSRPQGLIVTRQFADDIRKKYMIQTTPIIWLSTVQGGQNMDPAKLALLTDYITNFMESSQNGVVLVDGIEYLITSNDFQRVQKAIDRWTESAMTSNSRLIISVDDKAFETKELATMERDRETVHPDARESWRVIPERI